MLDKFIINLDENETFDFMIDLLRTTNCINVKTETFILGRKVYNEYSLDELKNSSTNFNNFNNFKNAIMNIKNLKYDGIEFNGKSISDDKLEEAVKALDIYLENSIK